MASPEGGGRSPGTGRVGGGWGREGHPTQAQDHQEEEEGAAVVRMWAGSFVVLFSFFGFLLASTSHMPIFFSFLSFISFSLLLL